MVAQYLERLIEVGQPTDWDWARLVTPRDGPTDVTEIWERFYNTFTLPPGLDAPGVENRLAFDAEWQPCGFFSDEARFRMVIDFHFRQDSLGVIIDWKTNRVLGSSLQEDYQLRTYAWGLRRALYPEVQEVLLRLHYLRYGREQEVLLAADDLD